ncbi:TPA: ABC-F family ATP-binding cassette domain-containing protein [Klebsiella aerogenes]|jgi:ATPase subunit of ABC transporter with duplicated ATPase domains|uniref:ABC-F family ATP-binding cassette domain-containing protein n=2 Tax=Klebsiella aerogenes TaxID=548 RepID=UPI000B413C49|nr:ABC-F family ATP-binding cassette domain-containing protein [Klebsiella aerogenes]EIV5416101.1 ABC-F family ATP-binding cassette domain-containing protein [Klebsiella aerogenes]EKU0353134.1 ABC-F family ATP-binding cassette domain-containing protein [Klebsiella aerogenes]ELA3177414.1 ABC-F family ATP-binding cassette domain-containing protein [Klebsiella aerogenes]ELN9405109.1 ABC-F family ATP-binding cassette domain-containing protein [Klebsiella aerogenes]ELX9631579.1 ABC-F family ATP-bin
MSTLLSAQSLHVDTAFGPLFNDLSFTLKKGDRIGLIGYNGCGKSTLLQVLDGTLTPNSGSVSRANHCLLARVEQHLPDALLSQPLLQVVLEKLAPGERDSLRWQAERLLAEMGFTVQQTQQQAATLSGGQHTRLLLARALIQQPDLLLLDEPGNHLDLPTLLWLESFLQTWQGSFVVVSHDNLLLDAVTNTSWILRDNTLHAFSLPCSAARQALQEQDASDALRHKAEQKEIDRVAASAKRLAIWGRVYDNEDLARKAKQMEKQVSRLKDSQTELTAGTPWRLEVHGDAVRADRLLEMENLPVPPAPGLPALFTTGLAQLQSGDRVAIMGRNGGGKSSLLRLLWRQMQQPASEAGLRLHPRLHPGYYDQTLHQLADEASLLEALEPFEPSPETRKRALISAGFGWARHGQKVSTLSGGERSRLLFVGLSLASYSLLLLDEPTNHLDMEGKEALAATLREYPGGLLLVSHDRQLISQSCNRFWLIDENGLSEWHDVDEVYARLRGNERLQSPATQTPPQSPPVDDLQEDLLERLVMLEQLLADDLQRKPKHQKPQLQALWRQEIEEINTHLS